MNEIDSISEAYDQRFKYHGIIFTFDDVLDICTHLGKNPGDDPLNFLHNCGLFFRKIVS